jgi:hypothetical protein
MWHRYSIAGLIWLVAIGCWLLACSFWLIANSHKLKAMSTLAMRPRWGYTILRDQVRIPCSSLYIK